MTAPVSSSPAALLASIAQLPQPTAQPVAQEPSQPLFQRSDSVQISPEAKAMLAAEQAPGGG